MYEMFGHFLHEVMCEREQALQGHSAYASDADAEIMWLISYSDYLTLSGSFLHPRL